MNCSFVGTDRLYQFRTGLRYLRKIDHIYQMNPLTLIPLSRFHCNINKSVNIYELWPLNFDIWHLNSNLWVSTYVLHLTWSVSAMWRTQRPRSAMAQVRSLFTRMFFDFRSINLSVNNFDIWPLNSDLWTLTYGLFLTWSVSAMWRTQRPRSAMAQVRSLFTRMFFDFRSID